MTTSGSRAAFSMVVSPGERRRHQHDMGCADGDLRKAVAGADKTALRRARPGITVFDIDFRAQRLKGFQKQVHGTGADGATARQRHGCLAGARQKRTDNPEARAHLGNEFVGSSRIDDIAGGEVNGARIGAVLVLATPVHRIIDAVIAEDAYQLLDIGQMRHVFECQRIVGQKRSDHQWQGGVFRAGDRNDAIELVATDDFDAIHAVSPSGQTIAR